jgi:hypothetical protein
MNQMMQRTNWKKTTSQIEVWALRKLAIEKSRIDGHLPGQVGAQRLGGLLAVAKAAIY